MLKLYIRDWEWEGAEILVCSSMEEAKENFFGDKIASCFVAHQKHIEAEIAGREPCYNPHMWQAITYIEDAESMIDVYDIKEGLYIFTHGDC
jgi:hypothetical protein